jgi:hypothetical protein
MASHNLINLSNSSATRLSPNGVHNGVDITIQNVNSSGYIYIGANDSVDSSDYGFRILPNHSISFELPGTDALYAIASSNGLQIAVIITNLEQGS